jgi:outer membrane receptor protein involved in Fe transport
MTITAPRSMSGVFAQAEVALMTNLLLNAGVRYDHFETFGDTVNPRLALIYSPTHSTTLKALYGTAFKAPNAYELYYSGPNNKGNTGLTPETIDTYELVFEQGITTNLTFTAAGLLLRDRRSHQSNDRSRRWIVGVSKPGPSQRKGTRIRAER